LHILLSITLGDINIKGLTVTCRALESKG